MVVHCIVFKRNYKKDKSVSYYSLPNTPQRKIKWIQLLSASEYILKRTSRICSEHFDKSQFIRDRLIKGALPSDMSKWTSGVDKHPVGVIHKENDAASPQKKKVSKQLFPLPPLNSK